MRNNLTITSLRKMLDKKEITPREAVMLCWGTEDVFSIPLYNRALRQAKYASERIADCSARDTTGIPIAIDSSICIADMENFTRFGRSGYDATIVRKLDRYGALIIGVTDNAFMSSDSSSTASRALYNRNCLAVLGSGFFPEDSPASFPRITVLKPSLGTVSRYGVVTAAPSLTQISILATNTKDVAIMMDAISDFDPHDPAMRRPNCYDYAQKLAEPLTGMAIRVCSDMDTAPLLALGCTPTKPCEIPSNIVETHRVIQAVETVFTLANCQRSDILLSLRDRIDAGNHALKNGQYTKALVAREDIARKFTAALEGTAALLLSINRPHDLSTAVMAAELCGLPFTVHDKIFLLGHWGEETTLLQLTGALEEIGS